MTARELTLTVDEATQRLPLVRLIVRDIMELTTDVHDREERLRDLRERYPETDEQSPYSEEVLQMAESLDCDRGRIRDYEAELHQVGAELADAATGLVEFSSTLDGVPVRLSWLPGEELVGHWRLVTEDPDARRPLNTLSESIGA